MKIIGNSLYSKFSSSTVSYLLEKVQFFIFQPSTKIPTKEKQLIYIPCFIILSIICLILFFHMIIYIVYYFSWKCVKLYHERRFVGTWRFVLYIGWDPGPVKLKSNGPNPWPTKPRPNPHCVPTKLYNCRVGNLEVRNW